MLDLRLVVGRHAWWLGSGAQTPGALHGNCLALWRQSPGWGINEERSGGVASGWGRLLPPMDTLQQEADGAAAVLAGRPLPMDRES